MSYRSEVVTVFGGSGFVGRHLIRRLAKTGAIVRVVSRHPNQANFLKTAGSVGQIVPMAADVKDDQSVARAIQGADTVINLIGTLYERGAWNFQTVHVDAPARIARIAKASGVRHLVHVSAIGADPQADAVYARTKGEGEAAVRAAFPAATIVRPSIIFGQDDQFTNRFARLVSAAPVVPVIRGDAKFQPVSVADIARAIALAVADPARFGGETYELAGPDTLTLAQIMAWIAGEAGRSPTFVRVPDALARPLAALTGWAPGAPITLDQFKMLLRDTVAAPDAKGFAAFGIHPAPMAALAPAWLMRYRRNGRFARTAHA